MSKERLARVEQDLILYAFKYAFNKDTFAKEVVMDALIHNWNHLSLRFVEVLLNELNDLKYENPNYELWNRLKSMLKILEVELNEQNQSETK